MGTLAESTKIPHYSSLFFMSLSCNLNTTTAKAQRYYITPIYIRNPEFLQHFQLNEGTDNVHSIETVLK